MSIPCPRCGSDATLTPRAADAGTTGAARAFTTDQCARCGGLWVDAGELGDAHPALAEIPKRLGEVYEAAEGVAREVACPHCRADLVPVNFFDVRIDFCMGCRGVWLDGGELVAIARSVDRLRGASPPPVDGGDRATAAAALQAGRVRCNGCGTFVDARATVMTSRGVMCDACGRAAESVAVDPSLADEPIHTNASVAADVLAGLGSFLNAVLSQNHHHHHHHHDAPGHHRHNEHHHEHVAFGPPHQHRCPTCGSSAWSGCGH